MEKRLFINGKYIDARTSSRLTLHNPGDGSLIASDVHVAEEADVNAAVAAARAAFPLWASKDPSERAAILNKFADAIEANAQELGRLETLPSGKPTSRVQMVELKLAAQYFRYYAGWCDKLHGEATPVTNGFVRIVTHEPFGVCACICPFNAPVVMACTKLAPALAAGNTAVIKPSEKTPLSTIFLGRLANEAGIPAGVLNVVTGAGPTGALLASHMDVNKISFTGSCATGKKIAQMAAGTNLKRVSLELGGKSPSIIFPDANLDVAVEWCVRGITTMTGQVCMASSRVYVHKSIRDKFVQRFQAALKTVASTIGDPSLGSTTVGPLVDKLQFERVMSLIDSGKKEAKLLQGGQQIGDKGYFVEPTVFVEAPLDARVYKEEIFGPVVVVSEFEDEEEVIARANDTEFGLSGAVYSQDINRAMRVASKINSGTICINCAIQISPDVPFGGTKQSGWGRESGKYGILSFTEPKTTFIK